jgi:hypothetical protein
VNLLKWVSVVVAVGLAAAPLGNVLAQDAALGSWVLDAASSKGAAGLVPTVATLEVASAGEGKYTHVAEATVNGATGRTEVTLAIDGKDYATVSTPAPPGAPAITQAMERVSDTVFKISVKLNGQLIATSLNEISSDRNTLTQTTTGIGQFAVLSSTVVFVRK